MIGTQIALDLRLRDASSFENFLTGENSEALAAARRCGTDELAGSGLMLFGAAGTGKTHLIEAACRARAATGARVVFAPLRALQERDVDLIEDAESAPLVCLDDVDAIAGQPVWERALVALFDRLRDSGSTLIASARAPAANLAITLPDLRTRLSTLLAYELSALDDTGKQAALELRARNRGFDLTPETTAYLLARFPRDMHSLFGLLDRLDAAALAAKRRVTVPFIRDIEAAWSRERALHGPVRADAGDGQ